MAKNDDTTPNQTPPVEDGTPNPPVPLEDVKVTKADHRVVSSIGLAPGGLGHRLVEPGEVLKHEDFGVDEDERKTTIARLISLGAIEPVKKDK